MNRAGKRGSTMGTGGVIGEIAQGALAARAFEPTHGESNDTGHTHESVCLNCGIALIGSHCHNCGQAAHVHRTLGAFFHDLLHGVFHFEGKIWRTLPMLVGNPGRLTREYIDGRRASYVSPIALFLFSVFLMFAVIRQVGGGTGLEQQLYPGSGNTAAQSVKAFEAELTALKDKRAALVEARKPVAQIDAKIAQREQALLVLRRLNADGSSNVGLHSDVPAIDRLLKIFRENPGLAIYKLQSNAYKYSWALIPISVPFVWLLFPFSRRYHLYDHTVFVTYSLCFMTLLTVLLVLLGAIDAPGIVVAALLVPPWHMYRQLRGAYALRRRSAIWRTGALLFIALGASLLFAMLILAETST